MIDKNVWYLDSLGIPAKRQQDYLTVMEKYDTEWWKSDDPTVVLNYQLNEPFLLIPYVKLQHCLEVVLGCEKLSKLGKISFNNMELKTQAIAAIKATV